MDVTGPVPPQFRFPWRRAIGIGAGLGTQLLFAFTVWHLFFFLRDGGFTSEQAGRSAGPFLLRDAALALQFALVHSTLLYPAVKRRLLRWIPAQFYGCFFCVATCLTLLTLFGFWRPAPLWRVDVSGTWASVLRCGFYGSWVALFYSLWLSGLGYQTGWTPWWHWFRRVPSPPREFQERGAYRVLRHPIYLSFLGLIWFTPHLTADRAVLMGVWTAYIAVGSYLKDERLATFLGRRYREYQQRVPGYPWVGIGPLGRRPVAEDRVLPDGWGEVKSSPSDGPSAAIPRPRQDASRRAA